MKLGELNDELNYYLAREYAVDIEDKSEKVGGKVAINLFTGLSIVRSTGRVSPVLASEDND